MAGDTVQDYKWTSGVMPGEHSMAIFDRFRKKIPMPTLLTAGPERVSARCDGDLGTETGHESLLYT